jgi:fatty-acyl-CoA synthase
MTDVPHDGESYGEIVVRTPWLTMGYLDDEAASEQLWAVGYLHTGDVALIDTERYLRISDRLKDIVKSGGEWISSISLENIIMEKKGVRRVAVIGVKEVRWGERQLALVVFEPDHVGRIKISSSMSPPTSKEA